jgi:16S rRNA C967 or C1407 C5-methylase (RsmB/RsmF family)
VQNLSSQLPPALLGPEPGERVLDLCAAPGSKTGQIAALMENEGEIAAVEKVRPRFFRLRDNLDQQGATAVRTFLRDGQGVWKHRPEHFDRVLVDAPCSTEGRFDTEDPDSTAFWHEGKAREMARKQGKLLWSGIQALRPGGTLVYATCTFAPEENEAVVDRALRTFGEAVEVVPLDLGLPNARPGREGWGKRTFDPQVRGTARVLPTAEWEAFYVAKLVKRASTLPDRTEGRRRGR